MKKTLPLIVMLIVFTCISRISIADVAQNTEEEAVVEALPKPYSESDLYGYWMDAINTQEVKILKLMVLFPNNEAIDSLLVHSGDDVEEVKQFSKWKFNPESSVLTQDVTNITYKLNGKIEPKDFGEIEPVKVSVTFKQMGNNIFMATVTDDGTLEIYQKITAEMRDEIHKKAQENITP
ncbi:hypothetical protein H7F13_11205 [Proteus vulgaris]|uniref:hypothetical protein n=1 Tax=Proteus faecis TaxID=2050967 RepID=UPI00163D0601|nr:hypothetical protein H7F13_11205 [Proteus vulgaris]